LKLESSSDGGILDVEDLVNDVVEDKDKVSLNDYIYNSFSFCLKHKHKCKVFLKLGVVFSD